MGRDEMHQGKMGPNPVFHLYWLRQERLLGPHGASKWRTVLPPVVVMGQYSDERHTLTQRVLLLRLHQSEIGFFASVEAAFFCIYLSFPLFILILTDVALEKCTVMKK